VNFLFKVGGLTVALFSFIIIALYISYQLSYDRYHRGFENIYRVNTDRKENGKSERYGIAPLMLGPAMREQFSEIAACARMSISNESHLRYKDKAITCGIFPADSSLFNVLTFRFLEGTDDALKNPASVVLTKSISQKLFGAEPPLHKLITINNENRLYEVRAVIEDMPQNSHFVVDGFIPMSGDEKFSVNNIISPVDFVDQSAVLFIRFRENTNVGSFPEKLETLLDQFVSKKERAENGFKISLQPLKNIYLDPPLKYEFTKKGSTLYLYLFSVLGIFLLIIGSINYINLSVADFSSRSSEIGIRKAMGAPRKQIAFQVILETVIYCVAALVMSLGLVYLLFPKVLELLEPHLTFGMLLKPGILVLVFSTLLLLIALSTAFPAYWLATSKIACDLKAKHHSGHQSSIGKVLLIAQFVISVICICATLVVGRQLEYIHIKDLGIDRQNLIVMKMPEDFSVVRMQALKNELKTVSGVSAVSNSSFRIGGGYWKDWYTVEVEGEMKNFELYEVFSDDELFSTLGMKVIEGRTFHAGIPADSGAAFVINETAARELGLKDPVGKRIYTHPEDNGRWDGTIVGVVGDINISSLHEKIQPLVMRLPWQKDYPEYFVYVRINGDIASTLMSIEKKYKEIVPGYPLEFDFVDAYYNNQYQAENRAFASLQFATVIIVLVSGLGIFSLSVYMSGRRMKEFGIRKVLGASVRQITLMHMGHFLRLAFIANVMALPTAYVLMGAWLDGFAYRAELSGWIFLMVMLISFLLVILSAGHSALAAGRKNPLDVIRMS
jgi:putative ABC transport system permease protein